MKVVRCTVCGNSYLGEVTLSRCPFCSVDRRHLVPAPEWQETVLTELSPTSRANLERALQLASDSAEFYEVACESASDPVFEAMFGALARSEAEHAGAIARLLDAEVPRPTEAPSFVSAVEYLAAATKREKKVARFYAKAGAKAEETAVKSFFAALAESAAEHMSLSKLSQ